MESDQCFETLDSNQMLPYQRILGQDIWDQEFDEIERESSTGYAVHQMKTV